jgi:phosphodiesterase/alkaline phosphatase D-like protein
MQVQIKSKLSRHILPGVESMKYIVTKDPNNSASNASGYVTASASYTSGSFESEKTYAYATITGLDPNSQYYYWLYHSISEEYINYTRNTQGFGYSYLGAFKTYPLSSSAYSFSASFSSCQQSLTTSPIFEKISTYNPNVFIHMGDLHYWDGDAEPDVQSNYEDANEVTLASGSVYYYPHDPETYSSGSSPNYVPKMLRNVPFDYVWDDHDFGENNSDAGHIDRAHASAAYRLMFPHYPLSASFESYTSASVTLEHQPIYHTFKIGRVKFIVTDNRSQRLPAPNTDNDSKYIWAPEQENWFKTQLTDTSCPVKVWVNSFPWEGDDTNPSYTGDDGWEKYTTYRRKIAHYISENTGSIGKLIVLSGDAHMTAIDDGTLSPWYSGSRPNPPMTIYQSAPLDQGGSRKGGPYMLNGADIWQGSSRLVDVSNGSYSTYLTNLSSSYINTNNRYGCMEVEDNLTSITMSLYSRSGNTATISHAGDYRFPSINGTYKKYRLKLDTSAYSVGSGGLVVQSSDFVNP